MLDAAYFLGSSTYVQRFDEPGRKLPNEGEFCHAGTATGTIADFVRCNNTAFPGAMVDRVNEKAFMAPLPLVGNERSSQDLLRSMQRRESGVQRSVIVASWVQPQQRQMLEVPND